MDIPFLDRNPQVLASYVADRHLNRLIECLEMAIESAHFMRSKAHGRKGLSSCPKGFRKFVFNPTMVWVRETDEQFRWAFQLYVSCCKEFRKRYGRLHNSELQLNALNWAVPHGTPQLGWTRPPPFIHPYRASTVDPVEVAREFYLFSADPSELHWTNAERPRWVEEGNPTDGRRGDGARRGVRLCHT